MNNVVEILSKCIVGQRVASFGFIRDYYEIVFDDDERLHIYSMPTLTSPGIGLDLFRNSEDIRSLIEDLVVAVREDEETYSVVFESGKVLGFKKKGSITGFTGAIGGEDF